MVRKQCAVSSFAFSRLSVSVRAHRHPGTTLLVVPILLRGPTFLIRSACFSTYANTFISSLACERIRHLDPSRLLRGIFALPVPSTPSWSLFSGIAHLPTYTVCESRYEAYSPFPPLLPCNPLYSHVLFSLAGTYEVYSLSLSYSSTPEIDHQRLGKVDLCGVFPSSQSLSGAFPCT
ncbi:uncharacterized protein EV420DRAFT_1524670 [Desarmillaria tabescens]|uniref:Uncharacterized protein n=1 Tax=Armillaria tabescens TaxID=1929756 RepID=A0AA39NB80_ARMTA|nr:uncharacterized protein EV420DRAFT_1524670 [Desarmillaria tabescens]KAK0462425.1 hypothetical protein EV420DRAFT_1524670 [Desarmillaria tabescens]